MRLTARLFSGRPDPSWQVEGDAARALQARLDRLPPWPGGTPPAPPGLGYRGIEIDPGRGPAWLAYDGAVRRGKAYFLDRAFGAERAALETGRRSLPADLFALMRREIDGRGKRANPR